MTLEYLCCPQCHHTLNLESPRNTCPSCQSSIAIREGVIDFIPDDDFYWGEVEQARMRQINGEAEEIGWFAALQKYLANKPNIINYATDPGRLGWLFHCYDNQSEQVCLDIGSGWGTLSLGLSRFYKTVYSVERVYERLHFQALRAAGDDIHNVHFLRCNSLTLPLLDNTVDLVVLNGILEWMGLADLKREPDELQLAFLAEVKRVLKPTGMVYIGIENRYGAQYFMGARDHEGLRFTSLMPRSLANLTTRIAQGRSSRHYDEADSGEQTRSKYRAYTYSAWGYQRLLRQVGFCQAALYWTWPSYSYPRMSGTLDGKSAKHIIGDMKNRSYGWLHLALALSSCLPEWALSWLVKAFSPTFLIIAGEQENQGNMQKAILERAPSVHSFVRLSLGARTEARSTFLLLGRQGTLAVVQSSEYEDEDKNGRSFKLEDKDVVQGRSFRVHSRKDIQLAANWLADFQRSTNLGEWPVQSLEEEIKELEESVLCLTGTAQIAPNLEQYLSYYIQAIHTTPLPIVSEHGDYAPVNILISTEGHLSPIDWEYRRTRGNPLMDVGAFSLSLLRLGKSGHSLGKNSRLSPPLTWFHASYTAHFRIPVELAPVYYLLRRISLVATSPGDEAARYLVLSQWLSSLELALEYSMNNHNHQ